MTLTYDFNIPKMLKSVVCYIDILGYKQMVEEAFKNNNGDLLLGNLDEAINESIGFIKPGSFGKMKIFTDNIVIGSPIRDDGEVELGFLFNRFSAYQLALALKGFFVRGAISVGDFYINENIVFGPALIEAYNLENQKASDPRIILSDDAKILVKQHLSYYKDGDGPQKRILLEDSDGQWFINYLYSLIEYGEYAGMQSAFDYLVQHKEQVIKKLEQFSNEPAILRKYIWIANYHKYFSDVYFPDEEGLIIDNELLLRKPRPINL